MRAPVIGATGNGARGLGDQGAVRLDDEAAGRR